MFTCYDANSSPSEDGTSEYAVLPVIGYLVQALFNISVIEVAPIFYIALGLCCGKNK